MAKFLSDFKALLFDVDKTLTNTQRVITPITKATLKAVQQTGVTTAVCTGRHFSVLRQEVLPLFPAEQLHITCGGGQLITSDGTIVWQSLIPAKLCEIIYDQADNLGYGFSHPYGQYLYVNDPMYKNYKDKEHLSSIMQDLSTLPEWGSPILIVTEVDDTFLKFLSRIPGITVKGGISSLKTHYVDITVEGVTKKRGLEEWSQRTNVNKNEIIGFGDGENDEEFLSEVGYSVALKNATLKIQQLAHKVIGHTDEDGVAKYIEGLLKGQPV